MPPTTPCDAGDVVLVRFPFTDLAGHKKRPAVVISPPAFSTLYGDLVLLALTSQPQPDAAFELTDWSAAGLLKPTWIKPIVGTIARSIVHKKLGKLTTVDCGKVRAVVGQFLAPDFQP